MIQCLLLKQAATKIGTYGGVSGPVSARLDAYTPPGFDFADCAASGVARPSACRTLSEQAMGDLKARLQVALGDAYRIERELGGGGMRRSEEHTSELQSRYVSRMPSSA